jgi:RNA polymerase sigma factor (sigma-70 family)
LVRQINKHLDEYELIAGLRKGDESAFRRLVTDHGDRLYRLVFDILRDPADAEDALQEVFMRVHASISSFRGDARLSTWLYQIAVRKALEKLRSRRIRQQFFGWIPGKMTQDEGHGQADWQHPGIRAEDREKARALFESIDKLPERQRIAFTLTQVQRMSYDEASGIMGLGLKAVESLVSRAKANLRKRLETHRH